MRRLPAFPAALAALLLLAATASGSISAAPELDAAVASHPDRHPPASGDLIAERAVDVPATVTDAGAPPVSRSAAANGVATASPAAAHSVAATTTAVCPAAVGGATAGAPGRVSDQGVAGTSSADLAAFAATYNAVRVAHCLEPVPFGNIRYDSCMEDRLFWMAHDPSTDPLSAWGHLGSQRSDGVPSAGCDGNLAGGSGNSGAVVAQKWWASLAHRASLYQPGFAGSTAGVCIGFAMTHGGVPNEPTSFTRAAARWVSC